MGPWHSSFLVPHATSNRPKTDVYSLTGPVVATAGFIFVPLGAAGVDAGTSATVSVNCFAEDLIGIFFSVVEDLKNLIWTISMKNNLNFKANTIIRFCLYVCIGLYNR